MQAMIRRGSIGCMLLVAAMGCRSEGGIQGAAQGPTVANPPTQEPIVVVDRFRQIVQPRVDVLFVVDNSSSMGDEQQALALNFPLFLAYFLNSGLDYHIGVVATDVELPQYSGRLRSGQGVHFIDPHTPNPEAVFNQMVAGLGVITGSEESGRAAAYMALEVNRDHPDNHGFYRDYADLHVIFVSDTDDNSLSPAYGEFLSWADNLKPDEHDVVFHAIVQRPGDTGCGFLRPGFAYLDYVNHTGGVQGSICESDWTPVLDALGLQSTGLKQEFFLRNLPELDQGLTIQVRYPNEQGVVITLDFAWCMAGEESHHPDCEVVYNVGRNSIVFLEYVAEPLAEVLVTYTPAEGFVATDGATTP